MNFCWNFKSFKVPSFLTSVADGVVFRLGFVAWALADTYFLCHDFPCSRPLRDCGLAGDSEGVGLRRFSLNFLSPSRIHILRREGERTATKFRMFMSLWEDIFSGNSIARHDQFSFFYQGAQAAPNDLICVAIFDLVGQEFGQRFSGCVAVIYRLKN